MQDDTRIIFLDPFPRTQAMVYTQDVAAELADLGKVIAHFGSRAPDDLVEEHLGDISVLIGQTAMPEERLIKAENLRAIINVKANWEPNIDYAAAHRLGIHVLSAAPAMAPAVAEHCLGQAIALARGFYRAGRLFNQGEEAYGIEGADDSYSLYDAQAGIVGYGNVGKCLLSLLRPFGCTCRVYDPWLSDDYLRSKSLQPASLDEVLSTSDFIFLLAGVTTENENFLGREHLGKIRKDACVILASRAEIVDFAAFTHLASTGRLRAAIDVYPNEPVAADASFRQFENIAYTAHLAGALHASYQRIRDMMIDDVRQIMRDLPPLRLQRAEPGLAAKMRSR